ncbi:hypothetical protein RHGRI_009459 [Rhododendron griersonianum]|uniref:Uncharacterized protein n=1 Tax=Rhododendron griersonianum TaxID=479676 RepID=A0AAV6KEU8_9ERIC|nr:hypothetical protein RHGRI_009459 [Rhododendron griersonianum]
MEGVGSRLGRASSRYGSSSSAVFSGPVRKWKRRWVHVSYPTNNSSRSNNANNTTNNSSALVLCRWTPISGDNSVKTEEPPRRKFRYVPGFMLLLFEGFMRVLALQFGIVDWSLEYLADAFLLQIVVLEDQKQEASEKVDGKAKTRKASSRSDDIFGIPNTEDVFTEEIQAANKIRSTQQDSNMSNLNLDLGLKGHDEYLESDGEDDEAGKSGLD